jgi:hypothetical protein
MHPAISKEATMPSAPYHASIGAARADALFASPLQRSDDPGRRQVRQAIAAALGAYGVNGCAARVAQAYGEHPETAPGRMRWARAAAADAFGALRPQLTHAPHPYPMSTTCRAA